MRYKILTCRFPTGKHKQERTVQSGTPSPDWRLVRGFPFKRAVNTLQFHSLKRQGCSSFTGLQEEFPEDWAENTETEGRVSWVWSLARTGKGREWLTRSAILTWEGPAHLISHRKGYMNVSQGLDVATSERRNALGPSHILHNRTSQESELQAHKGTPRGCRREVPRDRDLERLRLSHLGVQRAQSPKRDCSTAFLATWLLCHVVGLGIGGLE